MHPFFYRKISRHSVDIEKPKIPKLECQNESCGDSSKFCGFFFLSLHVYFACYIENKLDDHIITISNNCNETLISNAILLIATLGGYCS